MTEEQVNKAMENRFDGVDKFDIVQELLELESSQSKIWTIITDSPDSLPEEGTCVIACDRDYDSIGECWCVCFGRGEFNGVPPHITITHWMPIPTLPKQ